MPKPDATESYRKTMIESQQSLMRELDRVNAERDKLSPRDPAYPELEQEALDLEDQLDEIEGVLDKLGRNTESSVDNSAPFHTNDQHGKTSRGPDPRRNNPQYHTRDGERSERDDDYTRTEESDYESSHYDSHYDSAEEARRPAAGPGASRRQPHRQASYGSEEDDGRSEASAEPPRPDPRQCV
mmetsp:Transcript_45350/g.120609  ORF Transcript_45350/g.120609 Transcript_45350/m.120609 type:complete len:184 (-) Transcript_45350:30-581(-)